MAIIASAPTIAATKNHAQTLGLLIRILISPSSSENLNLLRIPALCDRVDFQLNFWSDDTRIALSLQAARNMPA
jgi:hypothetical protein